MEIKSYGSGSSGNFYIVKNQDTIICLDCGIEKDKILKSLAQENIYLCDVSALLLTHSHYDHTSSFKLFLDYDIPFYCGNETSQVLKLENDNTHIIEHAKTFKIGSIIVKPIIVNHGSTQCYSYILKDKEKMIYFATDFSKIESDLSNFKFNEIWIECNFIDKLLEELKINKPDDFNIKYKRQLNVHSSLKGTITHLSFMDLEKCNKIYLIHLSESICDKNIIKQEISKEFEIETHIVGRKGEIE